jgi:DNA-binding CsgD family transcriptional regulator
VLRSTGVEKVKRLPWKRILNYVAEAGSERQTRAFCETAMAGLRRLIGADGHTIHYCGPGRVVLPESVVSADYPRQALRDYAAYYCYRDPGRLGYPEGIRVAAARWKDYGPIEIVTDFLEPNRIRASGGVFLYDCRGELYAFLNIHRGSSRGWSERDVELMSVVQPHLTSLLANLTLLDPLSLHLYSTAELAEGCRPLSRREAEIVRLWCRGLSARQLASVLMLSPRTVEHHLASAYGKLGVHTRQGVRELLASRSLARLDPASAAPSLSARQAEVAQLACRRLTAGEIAETLGISRRTAEQHLAAVYAKLGLSGRRQLVSALSEAVTPRAGSQSARGERLGSGVTGQATRVGRGGGRNQACGREARATTVDTV